MTHDVVIQENFGIFNFSNPPMPPERFEIADDLYIGKVNHSVAKVVRRFGEPQGYKTYSPVTQAGYFYAFVRVVPEPTSILEWDSDQRLQTLIALSRLVRPTSISFRNAGRVQMSNDETTVQRAFPAWVRGVDPDSWLPESPQYRDWLIESEMIELKSLFESMTASTPPLRVTRAFWYHEYASRTYYGEVRWVLVCTAIESLLNTSEYNSGAQFRQRVPLLASQMKVCFTEDDARVAWRMRSHLSHGGATGKLKSEEERVYRKLEEVLRCVVKRAFLQTVFASAFADDNRIRSTWPVHIKGKSI